MPAFKLHIKRQADGRNVVLKALGDFVNAAQLAAGRLGLAANFGQWLGHLDPAQHFVRAQGGFAVGQVQVFDGHFAVAAVAGQHHIGAQGDQERHRVANRRAIGHIAAQRARVAHRQAGKALGKALQLRPLRHQGGKGVRQIHRSANGDVVRVIVNLAQLFHARHVQHLGKVAVLLGNPQAHVGATGHKLRLRIRVAQRQQRGQFGGRGVGAHSGLWGAFRRGLNWRQRIGFGLRHLGQCAQATANLWRVQRLARQLRHGLRGVQNGAVAGAAAQIARQRVRRHFAADGAFGVLF